MSETNENLNESFDLTMRDSDVITIPVDPTLTQEGYAADAKAVGNALEAVTRGIDVNNQQADLQGHIILTGEHVPMSGSDSITLKAAIEAEQGKTGANIPLTAATGAPSIASAVTELQGANASTLKMSAETDAPTIAAKITEIENSQTGCVKSVNGTTADGNGNVQISEVDFAQNLTSDQSQASVGSFILRTTGGSRSVKSGNAQIQEVRGAMIHTGVEQESITYSVEGTGITYDDVSIDRDAFVEAMEETSGTLELAYTSDWNENPADYGITVTGSPVEGDMITVVYVAEDRGTITPATPTAVKATGWNLYNNAVGYARVVGYDGRYHFGGAGTLLQFSATLNGEKSTITPENNSFTVPGDGFVWVTGGDSTTTYITTEWTDWGAGPDVAFEAYTEKTVNLATVLGTYFPNGLLAVGTVYDSISLSQNKAISRIERITYDPDDLADIIASGRAWDADENYIYVVRQSQVENTISVNGQFTASDHGIELIEGTEVAPTVVILYGQNLKAKLTSDVVTISQQTLTEAQKEQVKENIGVIETFGWPAREVIKEVKNGNTTVGYMYGMINTRTKMAFVWYVGNSATPQNALVSIALPAKYKPMYSCVVPLKDAKYMEIRQDGKINLQLTGVAYAGGSVMYPLG